MFKDRQAQQRLVGVLGMGLALVFFFSIIVYGVRTCQGPSSFISGAPSATAQPTATEPPCTKPQRHTGDSLLSITSGGLKRSFLLHLPASYGPRLQPLVVGYHGYSWTAQFMERVTNLNKTADQDNFILALPQGVDAPPSWNAGTGAAGPTGDTNDVQFTQDLLHTLEQDYCVDSDRVYLTGFSLGGGMVYRIACDLTGQVAAIATVSGAYYPFGGCHAARPLPIMEIHGAQDNEALYNGDAAAHMASVHDYLSVWLGIDKCSNTTHTILHTNNITGTAWTHCAGRARVVHYRIANGKHYWPNPDVMDANGTIWHFFEQYRL